MSLAFKDNGRPEPVAIIGIGCRFPGGVVDPESFWRLLMDGTDAIAEIPQDRIDVEHYFDPTPATPGRIMTRWGGFLPGVQEFDADFFGIAPREAERMDPQQRLLLETAWEALEDAGQDARQLEGSLTGVFIGQWLSDFEARLFADPETTDFYMTTGSGRYSSSGRISYALGLHGASLTIDCACSSSLAAIHLAVRSLRSGESTIALAGGVNVILQPHITIAYSQSRMMAPDGRCKFGDASGDGYVRSEGAGLVVLKPLSRAMADGDRIYAVIRGSIVNNDGRSSGSMGTPSRVGQEELLRRAYEDAQVHPSRVGYIEAHGTGTRVGDPIELGALGSVLREGRPDSTPALVGSVKTNIGHTESAAGVAGLIKTALALHHEVIPQSLHCHELNPNIPWGDLGVTIAREKAAWPSTPGHPRVAGVSGFGIAGTNAHVVLEEAPKREHEATARDASGIALLPLSAKSADALRELAARYADVLESHSSAFRDICWSAATRRTPLEHRAAFVGADGAALVGALRRFAAGEPAAAEGVVHGGERPKVVFAAPGQGGQWVGMARQLAAAEPVFRASLERSEHAILRASDWRLFEQLHLEPGSPGSRLDDIDVIQPALVALEIAYAELWRSYGVEPDAVVGHSMGEVAAAHIAGVVDLEQAMRIICLRSSLMRRKSGQGAMALVDLSMEEAQARLAGLEDQVTIAVSNSPRSSVMSGDPQAVQQQLSQLEQEGIFCRLIKVDVASHSPQMETLAVELAATLDGLETNEAAIPIYSTVLARRAKGSELRASYWGRNLRQPVRFAHTIGQMLNDGMSVFIELGPHPVLLPSIQQTAAATDTSITTIAVARKEEAEDASMQAAIGALWAAGYPIDWHKVMPAGGGVVDLPHYPWQRERYWLKEAETVDSRGRTRPRTPALTDAQRTWLHVLRWVDGPALPAIGAHHSSVRVLLIDANAAAEQAAYRTAFAREQAVVQTVGSVDEAQAILREPTGRAVTAIVLLASGMSGLPDPGLNLLQSLAVADAGADRSRLIIATSGAQAVESHPRSQVDVGQATMWGLGRVFGEEHPELWGGLVDLDPAVDAETRAAQLAAEVCRGEGEPQIAWRDGRRFALRLEPLDVDSAEPALPWSVEGAWLITGGLGEVGLHLATGMVAQGVRRLVLVGRSGLPPRTQWAATAPDSRAGRRIAAVRALESAGAAVHLLVADVGDTADLERALRSYDTEAWPPIKGVLHAAGVLEAALATQTSLASLHRVLVPKLEGARNLDRLLPDVKRFVMVSSNTVALGAHGMASYAAANAGLDALAHDRRARGLHGLSIQSGAWIETGMNSGVSAEQKMQQLNAMGVQGFTPAEGIAVFDALSGRSEAVITVMPIDWSAFAASRRGRNLKLFEGRLSVDSPSVVPAAELSERLARGSAVERRQAVEAIVREALGGVLRLAPARIDPRKPLGSMGLSSLMAMELRGRLEAALGRPLSATLAWNYPTLDALVAFLSGDTVAAAAPVPSAAVPVPTAVAVDSVAGLSDVEVARLLRGKR